MTRAAHATSDRASRVLREMLAVGVRGYLLKFDAKQHLYAAIESIAERRPFFTGRISKMLLDSFVTGERAELDPLTSKERVITQLIAEGKSNKEMACILCLSVKTVETHRRNVMDKLGSFSVAEVVRYAVRTKLIES